MRYSVKPQLWAVVIIACVAPLVGSRAQAPLQNAPQRRASLTLEEAIRAAATNPSITVSRERANAARGTLRTAGTWSNPVLTYQVENAALPGSKVNGLEREESIFATLPLEPLYQLGPRVKRARLEVAAADFELGETRRTARLAVSSAFFRAAAAQIAVRSGIEVNSWLDSLILYTGSRVKEGVAAEADLLRLQVEAGRAEVDLAISRMELGRELSELALLTGIHTDSVSIDAAATLPLSNATASSLDSLTAVAFASRSDLAAASTRAKAASAAISIERRAIVREIGAMAGVKNMEGERSLMAGLSVPFPLFDRNAGEIQRARAEQRVAASEYELVRRRVAADIQATLAATVAFESALARTRDLLSKAEESRRIAEAAYREGAVPLSQVIEAARTLADARHANAQAYFGLKAALFELASSTTSQAEESER